VAKLQISHEFEAKYKIILGYDPGAKAGPFGEKTEVQNMLRDCPFKKAYCLALC
jgi:hypothetical protein